jgi:hypothetical protein
LVAKPEVPAHNLRNQDDSPGIEKHWDTVNQKENVQALAEVQQDAPVDQVEAQNSDLEEDDDDLIMVLHAIHDNKNKNKADTE